MKTHKLLSLLCLPIVLASLNSCSKDRIQNETSLEAGDTCVGLTISQATALADLFSPLLEENLKEEARTKAAIHEQEKVLDFIDVYVENGDTLMYAINYANNAGYVLIGADPSSFPILSHASQGTFRFNEINTNSPVVSFLEEYKKEIKNGISLADASSDLYDKWKDLGKEGYEYEIELCPIESMPLTKARRTYSSGKSTIYPFTGEELNYWCQEGGYNYYAENGACIGCPAIAIGMLMYDTSQRVLGNSTETSPSFQYYWDAFDIKNETTGTETARKLRMIADAIPNYQWGTVLNNFETSAFPDDIVIGLHNLGYINATKSNYNFETLYNNLKFSGYNYFGEATEFTRGVLLFGYDPYGNGGHIWFCDGYYEQAYTVKKKFLGITISSWTEYDDRLYMNWGWGPNGGNGWYCATDTDYYWSSLDNPSVRLRYLPQMIVNLSTYVIPENNETL